jgi:hydrogenase-4 component E
VTVLSTSLLAQAVSLSTGLLLLTAVLELWRRSLAGSIVLLAVQGAALAGLVATLGLAGAERQLLVVAVLVLVVKAVLIPWILTRTATATGATQETAPRINPTSGLLLAALLTTVAYLAGRPVIGPDPTPTSAAMPVGLALVLIGFLILIARRQAISQLVGFVVLDNGIATVAFLLVGGVPLVVELGVMLDVLLVVLILRVLAGRLSRAFGATDLDDLRELRD